MTDPEARLAAALKAARLEAADPPYRHYPEMASDVFTADPTLAADLALAAAVLEMEPGESLTVGVANPRRWQAATNDDKVIFWADTPAEAIALLRAAKEAERE